MFNNKEDFRSFWLSLCYRVFWSLQIIDPHNQSARHLTWLDCDEVFERKSWSFYRVSASSMANTSSLYDEIRSSIKVISDIIRRIFPICLNMLHESFFTLQLLVSSKLDIFSLQTCITSFIKKSDKALVSLSWWRILM